MLAALKTIGLMRAFSSAIKAFIKQYQLPFNNSKQCFLPRLIFVYSGHQVKTSSFLMAHCYP
jgi:hypothetical protein